LLSLFTFSHLRRTGRRENGGEVLEARNEMGKKKKKGWHMKIFTAHIS